MADFTLLSEAKKSRAKNVKGIVVKASDLKAGTGANGDWMMKVFTLEDQTGQLEITAWKDDTAKLELGGVYEIESLWWKEYEQNWSASLGKYTKVTKTGTGADAPKPEPTPETPKQSTGTEVEPSTGDVKFPLKQKLVHDEIWAFAVAEATKVYPLGTAGADPFQKDRLILAQVFYKKNMDYYIHREGRAG